MNRVLYLLLTLFVFSCKGQSCENLKDSFKTFKEAQFSILETKFSLEDSLDTSKSSWIKEANYFSCDDEFGYLILETSTKKYIFKKVPLKVWEGFKKADSFGKYYSQSIRGKYQFILNK